MIKTFLNLAARFNAYRSAQQLTQTSLMEPAGIMANGESTEAKILFGATKTVERILKERARLDIEGRADEPLIVVMGKNDHMPAHMIHDMLVLKALNDSEEKTVCAMEERQSNILNWLKHTKGMDENKGALRAVYNEFDRDGKLALLASYENGTLKESSYAKKVLQRQILDMGMPVRFTDAALKFKVINGAHMEQAVLDSKDPKTLQSIKECGLPDKIKIDQHSPEGALVCNHYAAGEMAEFAEAQNARIAIQITRNARAAGKQEMETSKIYPGEESMATKVKETGFSVLAVLLLNPQYGQIPHDHGLTGRELLEHKSISSSSFQHEFTEFDDILNSPEQEWMDEKLQNLGLNDAILTIDDPRWTDSSKELDDLLAEFDETYRTKLENPLDVYALG